MEQMSKLFVKATIVLLGLLAGFTVAVVLFAIVVNFTNSLAISGVVSLVVGIYVAWKSSKWMIRKQSEHPKSREEHFRNSKGVAVSLLVVGVMLFSSIGQGLSVITLVLSLMGFAAICAGAHQLYTLNKKNDQ